MADSTKSRSSSERGKAAPNDSEADKAPGGDTETTTAERTNSEPDKAQPGDGEPDGTGRFDPKRLRLSQDFDGLAGATKLITTVPVRKPDKLAFVRVHPDPAFMLSAALLLERVDGGDTYLVAPSLQGEVASVAQVRALYTAITRQGALFVWPVGITGPDGRTNAWNQSAQDAAVKAQTCWVRVISNLSLGAYEMSVPRSPLPEPEWPDLSFTRILELAFRDRFIDSPSHPVLKRLRGDL
jgi:hypothetical protein